MTTLRISDTLTLPVDAVTGTFGILAKKGAGKSNAAVVMAEEMWDAGVPWVAIDPKGDWYGLRSSADGKGPGLPIVVFGGRHGDVPLEPTAGPLLADLVLDQRLTCVLDVSEFSKGDVRRFLLAFAERLYRQADADPLHLFLEEAHEYLPQTVRGPDAELVGAWQRIVKQGRFKGLGCTLVSQRSASLNKDVLTQVDTLIVLRTTSPQDRAAVKAWVDVHADAGAMLDTLPSLTSGEAWVWSPEVLGTLERIRFRRRRTFDSGATPKVGQARRAPATLADVDLAAIKEQMAETIERAKADDPKELRKRIRDLERAVADRDRALAERPAETKVETVVETVEVPAVTDEALDRLSNLMDLGPQLDAASTALTTLAEQIGAVRRDRQQAPHQVQRHAPTSRPAPSPRAPRPRAETTTSTSTAAFPLKAGARRMVEVCARYHPDPLTRGQLSTLAHVAKGGTFSTYIRAAIAAGLIDETGTQVTATDAGLAAFTDVQGDRYDPTTIVDMWAGDLKAGARRMLDILVDRHPDGVTRDDLGQEADVAKGGTFSTYIRSVIRAGLADEKGGLVYASDTIFMSG